MAGSADSIGLAGLAIGPYARPPGAPGGRAVPDAGAVNAQNQLTSKVISQSPVQAAQKAAAQASQRAPTGPGQTSSTGEPLTREQQSRVQDLKKRDAEVRAHEQAHAAVGGSYASAPTYTYTEGPDGKKYAVGGEVEIDVSPERTPDATIRKMEIVIRAALAPAEPSSQDRAVASQAQQQRTDAQRQLQEQKDDELKSDGPAGANDEIDALTNPLQAQLMGIEDAGNVDVDTDDESDQAAAKASATAQQAAAQAYAAAAQLFGG